MDTSIVKHVSNHISPMNNETVWKYSGITRNACLKMRKQKMTYQMIGDHFGVTRQRVHQVLLGYRGVDGHRKYQMKRQPKFTRWVRESYPKITCPNCKKEFTNYTPSARRKPKYCGRKCYVEMRIRDGVFYATRAEAHKARIEKRKATMKRYYHKTLQKKRILDKESNK